MKPEATKAKCDCCGLFEHVAVYADDMVYICLCIECLRMGAEEIKKLKKGGK